MGLFDWFRVGSARKSMQAEAYRQANEVLREHAARRRNYEAASSSHRTRSWRRGGGDAVSSALAIQTLRNISRDLVRNNGWARNGVRVLAGSTVGWGIRARDLPPGVADEWERWSSSRRCHVRGRLNFYGLQRLVMATVVQSGGALVVRRLTGDKRFPLQLSVLEPDYIDTTKNDYATDRGGNRAVQGIEFDAEGRTVAYWLRDTHPGAPHLASLTSKRVDARDVLYIFEEERPEQIHGVPMFCAAIVKLKEFDEYSDARLLQQKIAACFAAFVRDPGGEAKTIGIGQPEEANSDALDSLEPGLIHYLKPGEDISFASPPNPGLGNADFAREQLREIAAAVGMPYEDLTGDFSNANYSSLRAGRVNLHQSIHNWRWNMLVPQLLDPVMGWFEELYSVAVGGLDAPVQAKWTPPPTQLLDPEKEGPAMRRMVRAGFMTPSEAVAELGNDPQQHWKEFSADMKRLDELGLVIDSDPRRVSDAGIAQQTSGEAAGK